MKNKIKVVGYIELSSDQFNRRMNRINTKLCHKNVEPEEEEDDEPWIDPAGGIHYGNEDDPAKMYE